MDSISSAFPTITICEQLKFTASKKCFSYHKILSISSGSKPKTADILVFVLPLLSIMNDIYRINFSASSKLRTPEHRYAETSPKLCPSATSGSGQPYFSTL